MKVFPYLVAIALIEEEGKRVMPLGGKSLKRKISDQLSPGKEGELISLELLLRVFQRSEQGSISRAAKEYSFLLIELPIEAMQSQLPLLKSEWLNSGDIKGFLDNLKKITFSVWSLDFIKYEGVKFNKLYSEKN